jgi:MFS transporter, CP family, cyanate transporter
MEDDPRVISAAVQTAPDAGARRGRLLIGVAIVLTGLNLRTAVTSVGPVLEEIESGLGISSGLAGLVTTMPVLCFAAIGFAGPPLSARFRDSHVLGGALLAMAAGLVLRSVAGGFALFLAGTVVAMVGGALGNVLLPGLVKRYFPGRTGLLIGAYSTALGLGGAAAAVGAQPIADATGAAGWRWALGVWAIPALIAAVVWLRVPAAPGASRTTHTAVRLRALVHSRTALALTGFLGIQALQAYVVIGWSAQYLRDAGLGAATAGLLLGLNSVVGLPISAVVPSLTVRPRLQRPLFLGFLTCDAAVTQGWGYVIAGIGPLLVGVLRGITDGYTGMFVLVLTGVAGLGVTGWISTGQRYVDDEVDRFVPGWSSAARPADVFEVAGAEAPVSAHVRPDDVSRRG